MRNLQQLTDKANELYNKQTDELYNLSMDESIQEWINEFKPLELAKLWHETCVFTKANPFGAGYDDEVYEALNRLGYFKD